MAAINKIGLICFLIIVFTGCKKSELNSHDYISYINNDKNELIQHKTFAGLSYTLLYEPAELKVMQEFDFKPISKLEFDKKKKEYEGLIYFKLKIQSQENTSKSPFKSMITSKESLAKLNQYCLSELVNDFYIETSKGTKKPDLFYVEEDFNMLNYNQMVLAFDTTNLNIMQEGLTFVYNDLLLNNGLMKFKMTNNTLQSIPKLNYTI